VTQLNRCLILGAGALGIKLGLQLQQVGHEVIGIRRNPSRIPPGLTGVAGDLSDPAGLTSIWRRHLPPDGGELCLILTPDGGTEAAYRRTFVEGLVNVVESLRVADRRPHVTFVSSTSVFGDLEGEVNELSAVAPKAPGAKILWQAEQWLAGQDLKLTRVRFSGIYGPSRLRLIDNVRAGLVPGVANAPTNRIHEDGCVGLLRCIVRSAQAGLAVPGLIHGTDEDQATLGQVCAYIARKLELPLPAFDGVPSRRGGRRWVNSLGIDALGYQLLYPDHQSGYQQVLSTLPR
jgi:nucleoside-diphosphate-sugar epimerase